LNAIKAVRNSNSEIDQLGSRLETLSHEVSDISYDLNKIVDQVEIDPQKTRELQDRLNELNTLLHKHGKDSIEELKALAQTYEAQLLESVNFKDDLEALQIKKDEILKEAIAVAKAISDRRKKATKKFEAEVEEVLSKLGMEKSQFKVHISDSKKLYINGLDQVEFMIDANSSGTLNPVSKVASGGEMARLMLALKAVGRTQESKCQVFDEIDTGVSGEVANRIGLLMKKLSEKTQCLAITHLPGVAAKGHQHLKVYKTEVDGIVQTKVESLNEDARIEELATMFSGNKLTESALETARTMRAEID
jgi:DNA repair protein RecN (Recombination protein N)